MHDLVAAIDRVVDRIAESGKAVRKAVMLCFMPSRVGATPGCGEWSTNSGARSLVEQPEVAGVENLERDLLGCALGIRDHVENHRCFGAHAAEPRSRCLGAYRRPPGVNCPGDWFGPVRVREHYVAAWYDPKDVNRATIADFVPVLGLLAREGPSTPYDLERHVAATLGNFWSFPHTRLYTEPTRLAALNLVTETRETDGRRRRVFAITPAGAAAVGGMARSTVCPVDGACATSGCSSCSSRISSTAEVRLRLAEQELSLHQAALATYEDDERVER